MGQAFDCTGLVKIYGYTNQCALQIGHSGIHTIQVEHRKHSHNGLWCVSNWPDCPGGCQGHLQDEQHTDRCEEYTGRPDSPKIDFPIANLLDANAYPKNTVVTFTMHRGTDESGISGEGKVLDGVIFEDGTTVVRWVSVAASQSTVIYDCSAQEGQKPTTGFQKFLDIHVRQHLANNTVITFRVPQQTSFVWTQPSGQFNIDQPRAEEASRYIMWAVQQPWFKFPEPEKGFIQPVKEGENGGER